MELHDNPFSPFSFKVRACLYEKDAKFEYREATSEAHRERLLALNPRGEVPALVVGDQVICDSKVICAYLEDRFPQPALLPADPAARARVRFLELKSDTDVDAAVIVLATLRIFRPEVGERFPEAVAAATDLLHRHLAYLDDALGDADWFGGEFSLADVALAPHLRSASFLGVAPGAGTPALAAWLERVSQRESIARALREMAAGFAKGQSDPDSLFDTQRLHWRNDRIEAAIRCGLGPWLVEEFEADRAFLSPVPAPDRAPPRGSA